MMMSLQDYKEMPPKPFMMQLLDNLSKTYVFLWDKKDRNNKVKMHWDDVRKYHNKNAFRSSLRKLNNEGLLDYKENKSGVTIELVSWDEMCEE